MCAADSGSAFVTTSLKQTRPSAGFSRMRAVPVASGSPGGTVTGVITPADVIGPTNQGIEPGSFEELVRAIDAGATYANVHSTRWPAGEIRGQIAEHEPEDND